MYTRLGLYGAYLAWAALFILLGGGVMGSLVVGRFAMSQFGAEALRLSRAGEPYVVEDVEADPRVTAEDLAAYRLVSSYRGVCGQSR